jgi:hypothetical protein
MKDQADHTAVRMPKYTGIIECDDEKLILKPHYCPDVAELKGGKYMNFRQ